MNSASHDDGEAASAAKVRVFFALWPDAAAGGALAGLACDVATQAGGRAPHAANLHVTLAFVGEVEADRVAVLCSIGKAVSAAVRPFQLVLDRVGMFRGSGIAWAGAAEAPAELLRLVLALNAALSSEGFVVDARPFHAHVTLARRCRRRTGATIKTPIAWPVTHLVLNASELTREGPRYREVGAWTLGSAQAPSR
jgi:2'-5' RNA ligase